MICRATLVLVASLLAAEASAQTVTLERRIAEVLARQESALIALRRDLHQHPELSGEEVRTAASVAARLRALGLEVRTGVGGHGVVALLRGSLPGPVVAFRADMDAVASTEPDPVPFSSRRPGVRHICGHDIHTTLALALAEGFAAVRADLPGSLLLVFQPAEERATGARAMLADGVFSLARPDAIYAVHTAPLEVGRFGTEPGPLLAGRDRVTVLLSGRGNLVAAEDSVRAIIQDAGTISAAAGGDVPADFVLAQVWPTQAEAGVRTVRGSLSIADPSARARARQGIEAGIARLRMPEVTVRLTYEERFTPGVTNDAGLAARGDARLRASFGEAAVVRVGVVSPLFSEDFGAFLDEVPGVMYLLGVSNTERGWVGMPHSPGYVADEAAIVIGARALTAILLDRLTAP
jgi:metal-dependent amidase/aminoacylase/carboxypeptidase family protein